MKIAPAVADAALQASSQQQVMAALSKSHCHQDPNTALLITKLRMTYPMCLYVIALAYC